MNLHAAWYDSPVGRMFLLASDAGLKGLWLEGQKYFGAKYNLNQPENPDSPVLLKTAKWLDAYFAGKRPSPSSLPLEPEGSSFQQSVWHQLAGIPWGCTTSYCEIAKNIIADRKPSPMLPRAVGGAVGHNPIAIIIPCHRVVGARGNLAGYAAGLEIKAWLLRMEGAPLHGDEH